MSTHARLRPADYDMIKQVALANIAPLLRGLFPVGKWSGNEFKIGDVDGSRGDSLSVNLTTGVWADFAAGQRGDIIGLFAEHHHVDREAGARRLAEQLAIDLNDSNTSAAKLKPTTTPSNGGTKGTDTDTWEPILPVPAAAPKPPAEMLRCDVLHEYFDADDRLLCYVRRHEANGEKRKQFYPLTYGRLLDGKPGWQSKAPNAPRPLYGLNRLSHAPSGATVLLCEGEKTADSAQRLFPDHVALAWMGGAAATATADVSVLADYDVILWADADEAGRKAIAEIADRLPRARTLDTSDLGDAGFDAADLELDPPDDVEAWLTERLRPGSHARLATALSASTWLTREIPPIDRLLGDFITTTSRGFIVGRTGLGKTMLGLAIGMGIALGTGFLHWRSSRPGRVLYIDGEMPGELLKQRIVDAARRIGRDDLLDNLMIYSTEQAEALAEQHPTLGKIEPLNTDVGQAFIRQLCNILQPDLIILDNVQALIAGVQKEEESWIPTLALVTWLTSRRIGQLWLDHTGHSAERQYGTATKSWRFDAVGLMIPLPDDQRESFETAFTLSFDHPGKARRRMPDNWTDFEARIIRLRDDIWTSEAADRNGGARRPVKPSCKLFHDALMDAIAHAGTRPGETTNAAWQSECIRRALVEPVERDDTGAVRRNKTRDLRRAKSDLQAAHWIGVDGERVMDLTQSYR
jgi:hypothetical protein